MVNAFDILQDRIMRSRLAGDPPDALVQIKVGRIGMFEFHRADELIALGRETIRRAAAEIAEHARGRKSKPPATERRRRRQAAAIYSRNACRSLSRALTCRLTTSPIETMPIEPPSSTTGRWRKRPSVIIAIAWSIVVSRGDRRDLRRHVPRDLVAERLRSALGDHAHHVALGKDAENVHRGVGDHDRAHPLGGEQIDDFLEGAMRLGGEDLAPLLGQNARSVSFRLSLSGRPCIRPSRQGSMRHSAFPIKN